MMTAAYVCRNGIALCNGRNCISKVATVFFSKPAVSSIPFRQASNQIKTGFSRRALANTGPRSQKEIGMAPLSEKGVFSVGKVIAFGTSALGLGAIAFYGLGFSPAGSIDRIWPENVKQRIHATYWYFGGSLVFTAVSAVACLRSPTIVRFSKKSMTNSWLAITGAVVALVATGRFVRSLPYRRGVGAKQAAWTLYSAVNGALLASLCYLGGPLLFRAFVCTAGIVGGMSTVAVCAPSDTFLNIAGPLGIGLGAVFAASLGSLFFPPTTALRAGIYSFSLYAGLVVFSALFFYKTQDIVSKAKLHSPYAAVPYDPINASLGIYMDTLCIFTRIVDMLGGGSNKKSRS